MRGMAERGETQALEDRWLVAIESPDADRGELLDVLAALARNTSPENAAPLGWMWLTSYREKAKVQDALALGRDLLLICGDNTDLRNDVLDLYRKAYADRPDIEPLIEASGLAGGRSPRRALRTLDICLNLSVGDFLIDRSTDKPAQVVAADTTACTYTVRAGQREEILDPDALALAYDPADPNDFRVLTQLRPDRLAELAESDPTALIIGLLRTHHGRIDSDHLEQALCPRVIPTDKWAGWWSKAKTALRRHRNVVVEGRNPVILTYHAAGQSLEEEMEPQWAQADSATKRLAVAETSDCRARLLRLPVGRRGHGADLLVCSPIPRWPRMARDSGNEHRGKHGGPVALPVRSSHRQAVPPAGPRGQGQCQPNLGSRTLRAGALAVHFRNDVRVPSMM